MADLLLNRTGLAPGAGEGAPIPTDVAELLDWAERRGIVRVDLKIGDLCGRLRHVSLPARKLRETLEDGVGFAGSHYGFSAPIGEDMVMVPDRHTAWADPFLDLPALSFLAAPVEAGSLRRFERDPRAVAERAEEHLRGSGIATDSAWLPEFEFYVLPAHKDLSNGGASTFVRDGYHASPPLDRHAGFRARATQMLDTAGIAVKYDHHETASEGQMEIEVDFGGLVQSADRVLLTKYIVRNLAAQEDKGAVFLPKPLATASGNGLHVHMKLMSEGRSVFAGQGYAEFSPVGLSFIAGVLTHIRSLAAFTNPSTNSYRRLVPGMEAPIQVGFGTANRASCIRIPGYVVKPADRRFEYRPLDATANPYLAFAAILMAGLDGVESGLDPVALGFGPYDGDAPLRAAGHQFPRTLDEALDALQEDSDYLTRGGVFPPVLLEEWITLKAEESRRLERQPHPAEFELYGDL
jgi:glutamine synthetase